MFYKVLQDAPTWLTVPKGLKVEFQNLSLFYSYNLGFFALYTYIYKKLVSVYIKNWSMCI
jgi:hypothetical protein